MRDKRTQCSGVARAKRSTAKRLRLKAQGCRRGYPGFKEPCLFNHNVVASVLRFEEMTQPLCGWYGAVFLPNVAEAATLGFESQPVPG